MIFMIFIDKTSQPTLYQTSISLSLKEVLNADNTPFVCTSSPGIIQTSNVIPSLPQSSDAARILTDTSQIDTSIPTSGYAISSTISCNHCWPKKKYHTIKEWQSFCDSYGSAVITTKNCLVLKV